MQRRCTLITCPACLPRSTRCWYDTSRVWPAEQSCRLHTLNILHPFFEIPYLRNFLRPSSPTRSWAERYHSNNPVLNSSSSSVSAPATGSSLRCTLVDKKRAKSDPFPTSWLCPNTNRGHRTHNACAFLAQCVQCSNPSFSRRCIYVGWWCLCWLLRHLQHPLLMTHLLAIIQRESEASSP